MDMKAHLKSIRSLANKVLRIWVEKMCVKYPIKNTDVVTREKVIISLVHRRL